MRDVRTTDWSEEVSPFWGAVIETALTGAGLAGLFKAGWTTIKVRGGGGWWSGRKSRIALLLVQAMLKKGLASTRGCCAKQTSCGMRRRSECLPSRDKRSHTVLRCRRLLLPARARW